MVDLIKIQTDPYKGKGETPHRIYPQARILDNLAEMICPQAKCRLVWYPMIEKPKP